MYDVVRHSLEAATPDELLPYAGDMTLIGLAETPRTTSEQETVDYWTELCTVTWLSTTKHTPYKEFYISLT